MSAIIRQMIHRKRAAEALAEDMREQQAQIIEAARGAKGEDGKDGAAGPMPNHEWRGTKLRFEKPDGKWGEWVDLKGKDGLNGAGGSRFNSAALSEITPALLTDFLVLERDGVPYRVSIQTLQALLGGGGGVVPSNVVTVNGTPLTVNGEYVTR